MAEERVEHITEEDFPLTFDCSIRAVEHDGEVALVFEVRVGQEPPGALHMLAGNTMHFIVPANIFRDTEHRAEFIENATKRFKHYVASWMMREAGLLFVDSGNYYLDVMGIDPEPTTRKELVRIHTNETEKNAAGFLGAKGQRSHWTRAEMERALTNARRSLNKPRATLDEVAEVLRRTHPSKGPASGEALGAMLRRFEPPIEWKAIR